MSKKIDELKILANQPGRRGSGTWPDGTPKGGKYEDPKTGARLNHKGKPITSKNHKEFVDWYNKNKK